MLDTAAYVFDLWSLLFAVTPLCFGGGILTVGSLDSAKSNHLGFLASRIVFWLSVQHGTQELSQLAAVG